MKKYNVKLNCPTILEIDNSVYKLFPNKEIDLPENNNIIQTYIALGYLQEKEIVKDKTKKEDK